MRKYIWAVKDWYNFKYNHKNLLQPLSHVRLLQGNLMGKISLLDIKSETEAQAEILVEEAVRNAEIEGMVLNRDAVRSSVSVRLGLPEGVGSRDRNADGMVDVLIDAIRKNDKPLTIRRLNSWHAALFPTGYSGLQKIKVGKMRGNKPMRMVSGPIGREKIHFEAPPEKTVKYEMDLYIKWWNSSLGKMDGILRAAAAHLRFLTIHPYEDGNGRIARALTGMALAQDENKKVRFYSISSQIMRDRKEYYNTLENVQNLRMDITEWCLWFINCVEESIKHSEEIIGDVLRKAKFWKENASAELNTRQIKVIQKLLDAGKDGFKGGLTTRKYVSMAKVSRATAFREIDNLLSKNIIKYASGKGRSVKYALVW